MRAKQGNQQETCRRFWKEGAWRKETDSFQYGNVGSILLWKKLLKHGDGNTREEEYANLHNASKR